MLLLGIVVGSVIAVVVGGCVFLFCYCSAFVIVWGCFVFDV